MLEENINYTTRRCISDNKVAYIARPSENYGTRVVMLGITKEQEYTLKKLQEIDVTIDDVEYKILPSCCFHVGEYDFDPKSNNMKELSDIFAAYTMKHFIPSTWDYNTNTCKAENGHVKWYDTDNPVHFMPYLYASIGKPKFVAVFKENLGTIRVKRKPKTTIAYKKASKTSYYARKRAKALSNRISKNIKIMI